jgi:hypothetical protein
MFARNVEGVFYEEKVYRLKSLEENKVKFLKYREMD